MHHALVPNRHPTGSYVPPTVSRAASRETSGFQHTHRYDLTEIPHIRRASSDDAFVECAEVPTYQRLGAVFVKCGNDLRRRFKVFDPVIDIVGVRAWESVIDLLAKSISSWVNLIGPINCMA